MPPRSKRTASPPKHPSAETAVAKPPGLRWKEMVAKVPGILTCAAAIGICIFAGSLESELAARGVAVAGAVVGVVGFALIVFELPGRQKRGSK
jgi:hypothetical protein